VDRTQLAERNRKLASFQHRLSQRERVRRRMLRMVAALPVPTGRQPIKDTFLLIRPDHLGDMLLTMPAIQALRQSRPEAKLYALVGEWAAGVVTAYPDLDHVLTVPFPGFTRRPRRNFAPLTTILTPYGQALKWALLLRKLRIETVIILRPDHWYGAMVAWLAGIPVRVGYDLPDVKPFLTQTYPAPARSPLSGEPREHTVLQSLRLVSQWATLPSAESARQIKLTFPVSVSERDYITDRLANAAIPPQKKLVVIHPGAGTQFKRWLPEHWAAVADKLVERLEAAVLFTGSDQEYGEIAKVMQKMRYPSLSLAGDTSVAQLVALYERAEVVLGPDSGPLHLAVASGAPTVHLYGPADPALFGPWGNPDRQIVLTSGIACHPCNILAWPGDSPDLHPCIRDITPRHVWEAALRAAALR
jgi:heptosyltransferase-2/heptosyltransferase-3